MQSSSHGSGVVEDVVTVDIRGGALETFVGAPFEQLVFIDRPAEMEDRGKLSHVIFGDQTERH